MIVNKLSDLEIDEVSLVDIPANNKKIIYKSRNGGKMAKSVRKDELLDDEDDEKLEDDGLPDHPVAAAAVNAAEEHSNAAEAAHHEAKLKERVAEAVQDVAERILEAVEEHEASRDAEAFPESKASKEGDVEEEETELSGEKEVPPREISAVPGTPAAEVKVPPDAFTEEHKEVSDTNVPIGGLEGEIDGEDSDDEDDKQVKKMNECASKTKSVNKSSRPIEGQVDLRKALAERDAKIAQLEKAAFQARDALVEKEYIEKATKEYSHIPGVSSEQLGKVLKHAFEKMDPEMFSELDTVLKASESMLAGSILTQTVGVKVAAAAGSDSSASARLNAKAMEIMNNVKKSRGESVTFEKAYMQALKENPKLYDEYLTERRYSV